MKGLLKNNIFATLPGAKILSIVMILLGIFIAAMISPPLLTAYIVLGIILYSEFAVSVVKEEFTSKWGKYKLTLPVMRSEIIKSQFLNQLLWTAVGTLFALAVTTLSWLLHGCPFDSPFDIVTTFVLGISLSLLWARYIFLCFTCSSILSERIGAIFSSVSVSAVLLFLTASLSVSSIALLNRDSKIACSGL